MAKDWKGFERDVAKILGAWASCVFRRTPGSGAWGKQGQSRNSTGHDATSDFHGDIVAPAEAKFPFSVECKTYKAVEFYLALYGKSPIFDWWFQCDTDARNVGLAGMLVFKENFKEPLVGISDSTLNQIASRCEESKQLRRLSLHYRTGKGNPRVIHSFNLKHFVDIVPYNIVRQYVKRPGI